MFWFRTTCAYKKKRKENIVNVSWQIFCFRLLFYLTFSCVVRCLFCIDFVVRCCSYLNCRFYFRWNSLLKPTSFSFVTEFNFLFFFVAAAVTSSFFLLSTRFIFATLNFNSFYFYIQTERTRNHTSNKYVKHVPISNDWNLLFISDALFRNKKKPQNFHQPKHLC